MVTFRHRVDRLQLAFRPSRAEAYQCSNLDLPRKRCPCPDRHTVGPLGRSPDASPVPLGRTLVGRLSRSARSSPSCPKIAILLTAVFTCPRHRARAAALVAGIFTLFSVCSKGQFMSQNTQIEWTDATWNPTTGCTKISPGCDNCYAERFAERFRGVVGHPYEGGFDLTLRPERLSQPLKWKSSKMIFVNSMSDIFHKAVPENFIDQTFEVMERADWHVFQILTKRSSKLRSYVNRRYGQGGAPAHIWMGVSIEDGKRLSRLQHLRGTNAPIKFLSLEPLIGRIGHLDLRSISWVIAGGESGVRHRPVDPQWVREIRDQCNASGTAFFFKQWGGKNPKSGGRELDGIEWNEYPTMLTQKHSFKRSARHLIDGDHAKDAVGP
jgi:protein gp37